MLTNDHDSEVRAALGHDLVPLYTKSVDNALSAESMTDLVGQVSDTNTV